ncbi:MAG TPA: PKD domain-containing protein, partial [Bacteroidia bacterium]|nr:PKD domain-containing protein [Bacteroidia bacterium]
DDFGFLIAADHAWGMLSSNRAGGLGSDDMYLFEYQKPAWNGIVVDAVTLKPVPGAKVALHLPRIDRQLTGETGPDGRLSLLLQRDVTYQVLAEADQYRAKRQEVSTYGAKAGDQLQDTIYLERPPIVVVTKVLDVVSGFPIANAKVRLVDSDITLRTDSTGEVTFYYDPYPRYAQKPVECPPQEVAEYCFRFKDEAVLEFDTLQLIYEWSFGDGVKVRELEPRHCYRGPGTYHVELNLLDPAGKLLMNQATYDLEVRPPAGVLIDGPDTVVAGQKATFATGRTSLEGCSLETFEWDLNSGETFSGLGFAHVFPKAGLYRLRLNVSGTGDQIPQSCSGCVTKEIVVMDRNWRKPDRDSLLVAWAAKPTTPAAKVDCAPQQPESYCFAFTEQSDLSSDTLPLVYVWDMGDGTKKQGLSVNHCYAMPGIYPVRLEVLDPYSRRLVAVLRDYDLEVKDLRQVYVESHDTISLGGMTTFDALKSDFPGCNVQAVQWNFGDGETATGPVVQHQYTRRGTFRVEMVVQGVDAQTGQSCSKCTYKEVHIVPGYDGNAVRDSLRNASTLADAARSMPGGTVLLEILKEGYEVRRLNFDPGTETGLVRDSVYLERPVVEGSVSVEIADEATQTRLQNATLTLRDSKTGLDIRTFNLESGTMILPLEPGKTYTLLASKPGYLNAVQEVGPIQKGKQPLKIRLALKPAVVGSSWILRNLYYDFDKSHIRHDAAIELEKLAGFLQANPGLTIELGSHTDVRGSDDYNLRLAQDRANSAVAYLKARGIAANRIVARGYGEQRLANRCADGIACSEELHQENRRTEITILGLQDPIYSQARRVEDIWGTESLRIPSSPQYSGPFTILVGTYLNAKAPAFFQALDARFQVTGNAVDGFWEYTTGNYPNYGAAKADLPEVIAKGYPHASILARPVYTLPSVAMQDPEKTDQPTAEAQSEPSGEVFYSVQVAVTGKTVQAHFFESFGDYKDGLFEQQIQGRRVFFVGKYNTEQEAVKHLAKIRKTGHSDAFLVHFDKGKKVNLGKIGAH